MDSGDAAVTSQLAQPASSRVRLGRLHLLVGVAFLLAGTVSVLGIRHWRGATTSGTTVPDLPVYPGKHWEVRELNQLGLHEEPLHALAAAVGGEGFISRHGFEAFSWGNPRRKRNFGSATKVFFSYLLFRAVEEGKLSSLDEPVSSHLPALRDLNPRLGYPDREFTWRHMATMTSCYGVAERPGAAFSYSDYQTMLLGDTLVHQVYKQPWNEIFRTQFVEPLEMKDNYDVLPRKEDGSEGWRPMLSARDMNRFGLLMMREGMWLDQPQITREDARTLLHSPHPADLPNTDGRSVQMLPGQASFGGHHHEEDHGGAFSYFWWLNHEVPGQGQLWPALPPDAFAAVGYGGRCLLMIVPSEGLVVSWVTSEVPQTRHSGDGRHWVNARMATLMESTQSQP